MSLINKEIVDFKVQAFVDGEFREITKADVLEKWSVFFFYPADFTKCERKALKFIYGDISSLKNNASISLFFIVLYF